MGAPGLTKNRGGCAYPESRSLPQLHMLESHSGRLERSCKPQRKPREFESHLQLQKAGSIPARSSRSGEKRDRFDSHFSTGEQMMRGYYDSAGGLSKQIAANRFPPLQFTYFFDFL